MLRRGLPALLATGAAMILIVLVAGPVLGRVGEILFVLSVVLFPTFLILLGAPRARAAALVLGGLLAVSAVGIVIASGASSAQRVLGLPPATWLMLGGLGLVPLAWVIWSHARTFDSPDDGPRHG